MPSTPLIWRSKQRAYQFLGISGGTTCFPLNLLNTCWELTFRVLKGNCGDKVAVGEEDFFQLEATAKEGHCYCGSVSLIHMGIQKRQDANAGHSSRSRRHVCHFLNVPLEPKRYVLSLAGLTKAISSEMIRIWQAVTGGEHHRRSQCWAEGCGCWRWMQTRHCSPPQQKRERWMAQLALEEPAAPAKCLENVKAISVFHSPPT